MENHKIKVSNRITRLPPYIFGRLNAMKYAKRRANVDVIDLGMGNPSDPPAPAVVEKLREAALDPRNHRYSQSIGLFNLRREVARKYARQWNVDLDPGDDMGVPREVVAVVGSKEGFSHLCMALLDPGDTVLVPTPAFPIHIYSVMLAGANTISVPLSSDADFFDGIRMVMERLYPRPKLLVLNFPHNPTTMTVELDFFKDIVKYARKYGLMVVHDFAYADTVFDGYTAPSILQVPGAKEVAVEFTTMSKPYNMAGWRIGFCVGNRDMVAALAKIKGYYDYGIFQCIQIAGIVAMRDEDDSVESQARVYVERRDVLCDGLQRIGWEVEKPKATMFVWAPIPKRFAAMGSLEFSLHLAEKANVVVSPGISYGEPGEGYVRFALVENVNRLKQAVRQIDRALRDDPVAARTQERSGECQ
jgi:alanine-synthesizing transaminase